MSFPFSSGILIRIIFPFISGRELSRWHITCPVYLHGSHRIPVGFGPCVPFCDGVSCWFCAAYVNLGGRELAGDSLVSISCRPQGHQGRWVCEVSSFGCCWFFCVYVLFCVYTVYLKSGPHAAQPFYPLSHLPSFRYVLPNHFGILEFYSPIPVHQLSSVKLWLVLPHTQNIFNKLVI